MFWKPSHRTRLVFARLLLFLISLSLFVVDPADIAAFSMPLCFSQQQTACFGFSQSMTQARCGSCNLRCWQLPVSGCGQSTNQYSGTSHLLRASCCIVLYTLHLHANGCLNTSVVCRGDTSLATRTAENAG